MTRHARRNNKKSPLVATPWMALKRNSYTQLKDEDEDYEDQDIADYEEHSDDTRCFSSVKKVRRGQLKETKKAKLTEKLTTKLSKKLKRTLTVQKLKEQLSDSESLHLLSSDAMECTSDAMECTSDEVESKRVKNSAAGERKKKTHTSSEDCSTERSSSSDTLGTMKSSSEKVRSRRANKSSALNRQSSQKVHHSATAGQDSVHMYECKSDADSEDSGSDNICARDEGPNTPLLVLGYVDQRRKKRIEARKLRRQKKKVCFNCRQSGHLVQDCPGPLAADGTAGICFKCGSGGHTSRSCKVDTSGEFPYAKCFICGETGHLSRSCPDNPKGLYPNGGCCKLCGSVEHLRSNCPDKTSKRNETFSGQGLVLANPLASADAEDFAVSSKPSSNGGGKLRTVGNNSTKHRVVKF